MKSKRIVIPYRSLIKWLVRLRRSPRAISGGFALGTFIAFTPTIGVQFAIVIFLATLLNLNRPAALIAIWITNAATMAPIYTFNYLIGTFVWPGPPVSEVYGTFQQLALTLLRLEVWDMFNQFAEVINLGREIIIPLLIGSTIVGLLSAALVYAISQRLISYLMARREKRREAAK
jgi:uncharacterized protein (DUF2062 family)